MQNAKTVSMAVRDSIKKVNNLNKAILKVIEKL